MSLEAMPEVLVIILLLISWVVIAAGCHSYIKNYFLASFVAACVMVVGVQIASYIELGYVDPFWLISSINGFFMASIVALIVGLPFKVKRGMKREDI
jgi:peptidoglycan biosynthesis protein MviN/MurJ (putative lipid II flippase)